MLELPEPDGVLSAADLKEVAADVIGQIPLQGIEGSPLHSGDIWPVVTMASVNQSSVWEVTSQTDDTPCDDTVTDWLHTLQHDQLEMAATLLFRHLAMTILDRSGSRIVSIDFIDNPYHGSPDEDSSGLCKTTPTDGTTTCHRYCTAYIVSNGKPVTLALTYVRSDENFTTLPFTYLFAIPFYIFLDVAVLTLLGYLFIAWSIYQIASTPTKALIAIWSLNIGLPVFNNFIIQSDHLFIMGILSVLMVNVLREDGVKSGILGGSLIATKGMVWPALVVLGYSSIRTFEKKMWIIFGTTTVITSSAIILPFALYDPTHFFTVAPLGVQANHFPQILGPHSAVIFVIVSILTGVVTFELTSEILIGMFTVSGCLYIFLPNKFRLVVLLLGALVISVGRGSKKESMGDDRQRISL